ncbi:MAG TPA: Gmad2 immunoglobulin-like domain-containing protein [Anaerolineales bacterium]|nr:Gmad2 immunoglobulin-like domain-containing protein [Anaerolineales bacterium]
MKKSWPAFLLIGFALLACGWFPPPEVIPIPITRVAPTVPPTAAASALTPDQVKNAKYQLVFQDAHSTVQLTNGGYQSTVAVSSPDFMSISLAPQMAFGDLNGDGAADAAVLLAENYGGSGVFVSLIALKDQNGQAVQAASEMIDDRPQINSLRIQDGQIFLDALVHGPNDPGCCPALPTQRTLRYESGKLVMTSLSSGTPDGGERVLTITHPSDGDFFARAWPLTVTGRITIAPFENSLAYSVFDASDNQVQSGSLAVQASQPGGPGFFSLPLDLSKIDTPGRVRIVIEDLSPADGSILSLGSVTVSVR